MKTIRCTASWEILARGKGQLGKVPLGGNVTWENYHLGEVPGDFNLSDFLGTIFILIYFYLMNATNENYFSK